MSADRGTSMSRRSALFALGAGTLLPSAVSTIVAQSSAPRREALHYLSVADVGRRIAAREISPVALTQHVLDRIAALDPILKSYATDLTDRALADADAAERDIKRGKYRGPLHGVPIAVKDLCYTKGVRTMGGTSVLKDFVPDVDGTVVARLRQAGAVLLGKLNLTEGAMAGYNPAFGIPVNPWRQDRWPGASSSGAGVATAAGLCFAAIGTDTGGSIRFPSSANGIVGLKPTYGRVSRFGVLALAESLDHVGPMARRVGDVAIMFDAIAGHDPKDPTSLTTASARTVNGIDRGIRDLRIGVDRKYATERVDPGDAAALEEALTTLRRLGAKVVEVQMPSVGNLTDIWLTICTAEALAVHKANFPSRAAEYGPYFREVLGLGAQQTAERLADARKRRAEFAAQFTALLESLDAMACPAGGAPAWPVTREMQLGSMATLHAAWTAAAPRAAEFTMPMDLAGTPAICLPSGFSPDGVPYSIQFAGRRLSEPLLCRVANAYETATNWHERHPPVDGA